MSWSRAAAADEAPTPPVPAWPQSTEDTVVLKDGGMVRGHVVEMLPNERVNVQLATGQIVILPWAQVHHIEQGTPAPPTAPVHAIPPSAPPTQGSAVVHLEDDYVLEQDHGGSWVAVCHAPCDVALPLDRAYRVSASGTKTSGSFHLTAQPGDRVTVSPHGASKGGFAAGMTMLVGGTLVGTVGFYGWMIASAENSDRYYYYPHHDRVDTAPWLVTLGVGAVIGTVGLVMAVANEKTTVHQHVGPASSAAAKVRTPTWRDRRDTASMPEAPPSFGTPVLYGTF